MGYRVEIYLKKKNHPEPPSTNLKINKILKIFEM